MEIRGLIFDFDGLILETEEPVYRSWQEVYGRFGQKLDFATWATIIGTVPAGYDPLDELEALIGHPIPAREALEAQRLQQELDLIYARQPQPGVLALLRDARQRGLKSGVASSSSRSWVIGHLTRLKLLDYFDCVKARDDVRQVKPDAELYFMVLRELGLEAGEAIAFEDSSNGVTAARQAGLFCVAVPNEMTRSLPLDHANLRLDSLAEMSLDELVRLARARMAA
ncbi:MAG: HAD-IA family hydrolase [Anaerolineales bacterium]|nr:HAD-IA family hydrolase [Anaerolineales bacterium]MDD5468844.1 HAD-IA family hydrolase [Anaerolineales bacterium]